MPAPPQAARPTLRTAVLAPALIVVAGLAAYADSLRGPLVYDDLGSIPLNPTLHRLWSSWRPPGGGSTVAGRPILNFSFGLNYAFGGLRVEGYHAVNILIHVLAGLVLFGLVRRTWRRVRGDEEAARWIGLGAALLWTVHPLQTEAVTYLVQRAESLMGLFYLLTLYGFVRMADEASAAARRAWAAASLAACLLGVGTKEVMVTAPVMVLMFDRTFFSGDFRAAWRARRGYYLALAATWVPLAALIAAGGGNRGGSVGFGSGMPWWAYGLTQFQAIVRYLGLSFWPHPLIFDYGPFLTSAERAAPYAAVVVGLGIAALHALYRRRPWGFAGFWFFGILAVTSLAPGTSEMIVERRMYLPLAALTVLGAASLRAALGPRRGFVACVALAAMLTALTARRNRDYRSDVAIWSDTVARVPDNSRAQYNLGVAWAGRGRIARAIAGYAIALRLDPDNAEAQHSLGNALAQQGDVAAALAHLRTAVALSPGTEAMRYDYGTLLLRDGNVAAAIGQYEAAIRIDPGDAVAQDNLGVAFARIGRGEEAAEQFRRAIRLDPGYAGAHFNLAIALSESGRLAEAIPEYERALRLDPGDVAIDRNLGMALLQAGRPAEAVAPFRAVLRAHPEDANTHRNLGVALSAMGRAGEAKAEFARADELGR